MRSMKKFMSVLLTAAMVCAATFPAFASSEGMGDKVTATSASTADLYVGTGNPKDELTAFKVVVANFDDKANNLTYEFSETFRNFQASEEGEAYRNLTAEKYCDYVDSAEMVKNDFRALLGEFSAYIKGQDLEGMPETDYYTAKSDEDGTAVFKGVAMGQYIILGSGNSNGTFVYQTVTAEVIPEANLEDNKYEIYSAYKVAMKTTEPTAEKSIDETTVTEDGDRQTASIGDSVAFTLKATVPTFSKGATNTTFFMGDTLSEGLSWDTEKEIVVNGYIGENATKLTLGSEYTIVKSGQKLYIDFKYEQIKGYQSITVDYSAILNENAKVGTGEGNINNYDLVYSNDPFNGNTYVPENPDPNDPMTPEDPHRPDPKDPTPGYGFKETEKIVYTYALLINKYDTDNNEKKLAGATFEVYTSYNNGEWNGLVGTITTDENGYAALEGLEAGIYHLKETKAPAGYKLLTTDTEIVINAEAGASTATTTHEITEYTTEIGEALIKAQAKDADGHLLYLADGSTEPTTESDGNAPAYVKSYTVSVTKDSVKDGDSSVNGYFVEGISNTYGSTLPSTGGMGTTIFYVVGAFLMLAAAIMFITKKRMDSRN